MHDEPPDEPAADDAAGRHRRPSLWILLAALLGVSAVVLVLALAAPFEPGGGDAAPVAAGDATRGASLFEGSCAGCHGPNGSGGGVGPTLAGRELAPEAVAGVIASGRGAMPAGLVEGADRDDVVAYVVSLGSGEVVAPAAEETETETEAATSTAEPETTAAETVAAGGEGDAENGQALFENTCAGCHGIGATGGSGPALAGTSLTPDQIRAKVESGGPVMPAALLEGSDLDDVVAYLGTLGGGGEQAAGEDTGAETVAEEPPAEPVGDPVAGQGVFEATCAGCHGLDGSGGQVGPALAGADLTEEGVRAKIANGGDIMPAGLAEGVDLDNVTAYVLSISAAGLETPAEPVETVEPETPATAPAEPGAPPTGTVALTGPGLIGLQVNLEAPAEVAGSVFLVGPAKKKEIGSIAIGDSELEVENAGVGTILDGYDTVIFGPAADRPVSTAPIGGAVDAMRQLAVSSEVAPDGSSLIAGARGQVAVLRDHIRFLKQSLAEGNLVNVRFHGEHLVNIVRGEPIVNLDGLGGPDNPGDGVGLVGKDGRDGYLPLIAATTAEIAATAGADEVAAASAGTVGESADVAEGLLQAVAGNASTCAKAPSLQRARVCVRTIARLEGQIVQTYRQMNRFANRVPVFSLDPFEAG